MYPREIERWALRVCDQVANRSHAEDTLVELKADWPDASEAARKIAAHANAARGATILWLIGVDEANGVRGASMIELADWLAAFKTQFDGVYPEATDVNVPAGNKTVVALAFRTDRAPYVVKNPRFGQEDGGSIRWEVPWRKGRSTRTAGRQELLRLLVPLSSLPEIECLDFTVRVAEEWADNAHQVHKWYVDGSLYVAPVPGEIVTMPAHRASLQASPSDTEDKIQFERLKLFVKDMSPGNPVAANHAGATIRSPGLVFFSSSRTTPATASTYPRELRCDLKLPTVGAPVPCHVSVGLLSAKCGNGEVARWHLRNDA